MSVIAWGRYRRLFYLLLVGSPNADVHNRIQRRESRTVKVGMEKRENIDSLLATIGAITATAVSAIGLLSAFGYIISYKYLEAFYSTVGAPWALDLYPPTQIIQNAAPIAVTLTGIGFAVWNAGPNWAEQKARFKDALLPGCCAVLLYAIHLLISHFSRSYISYFNFLAFLAGLCAAFMVVSAFVTKVFEVQGKRTASVLLTIGVASAIFLFADSQGSRHAKEAMNGKNGRGSLVSISSDRKNSSYRMIRVIPYERALITTTSGAEPVFRVVNITDLVATKPRPE